MQGRERAVEVSGIIWIAILATYVVGLFPSAIWAVRQCAEIGRCQGANSRVGARSSRSGCRYYHGMNCWRPADQAMAADLKALPVALVWPAIIAGLIILRQARKKPSRRMLEAQITQLEREAGIEATS